MRSAFISYSWDDDDHREWVRTLAARLRKDGVDVSIDRWAAVPGDQLPAFMERAIRENQFVVIICTPRYKRRSDAREGGVGYEGDIMAAEVIDLSEWSQVHSCSTKGRLAASRAILASRKILHQPYRRPIF